MKTRMTWLSAGAAAGLAAGVAGCAAPQSFSYLDGQRRNTAEPNTFDTQIVSVDGKQSTQNRNLRVDPGQRTIILRAPPAAGLRDNEQRTLELNVEPCTHYWFEAKKENSSSPDWVPRVNYKDRIEYCGPEDPLRPVY